MTEQEWQECPDPTPMLELVRGNSRVPSGGAMEWFGGVSNRKLRLFDCACCRRVVGWLIPVDAQKGLDAAERHAEGLIKQSTALNWSRKVSASLCRPAPSPEYAVYRALWSPTTVHPVVAESLARLKHPNEEEAIQRAAVVEELVQMAHLARCVIGNPFRPVTLNSAWQMPTVVALAQAAYENRILPAGTLGPARLAVLADALEEVGCDNADILDHCRQPGEHVRGCWVLDSLLGKQ